MRIALCWRSRMFRGRSPLPSLFYGERTAVLRDPFGHRWNVGHHIEDVSPDEMQRRYDKMAEGS